MSALARKAGDGLEQPVSAQRPAKIRPYNATSSDRMTRRSDNHEQRINCLSGSAGMRSKIASSTTQRRMAPNRRNPTERCR